MWDFWTNMDNHVELEDGVKSIEVHGPCVTGTTGRTITADFEQEWEFVDVVEGDHFGIRGYTPDEKGTMTFSWSLDDHSNGTRITYRIAAEGPDVDLYGEFFRELESNAAQGLQVLVRALDHLARG